MSERTENFNVSRDTVFAQIDEERIYQNDDVNEEIMTVGDELTLLAAYLREAQDVYKESFGDAHETPALHSIRKLAAICVRCMEHHGAPERDIRKPRK